MRARLLFVVIATGCAISAVTACSSKDDATAEAEAKKTTQASSVTIEMFDRAGNEMGSCSGTLVAKDLVLTAGHCAAGVASWKIARGSDAKSEATRAVTPWKAFGSNLSHPDHADVALLVLKKPIVLDKYPVIASAKLPDGAKAVRFHRGSASATEPGSSSVEVASAKSKGFRLNYAAKAVEGQYLDTGGAIIDAKTGKIHGVVSGKGMKSDLLYITRVDNYVKWITKAGSCGGSLAVRGYPGGGSSSGGSSGWGGGDDWGGYGGSGKKLDGGAPDASSSSSSSSGSAPDSGAPGTPGSPGSPGTPGTPGDGTDTPGGPGGGTCPPIPSCEGECPGKPGGDDPGSDAPGDDDDTPSTSSSSGNTSGNPGTPGKPGTDVCPGPPACPEPDTQACEGPTCGGCAGVAGCIDSTIDYGSCASCGSPKGTGTDPVVR